MSSVEQLSPEPEITPPERHHPIIYEIEQETLFHTNCSQELIINHVAIRLNDHFTAEGGSFSFATARNVYEENILAEIDKSDGSYEFKVLEPPSTRAQLTTPKQIYLTYIDRYFSLLQQAGIENPLSVMWRALQINMEDSYILLPNQEHAPIDEDRQLDIFVKAIFAVLEQNAWDQDGAVM